MRRSTSKLDLTVGLGSIPAQAATLPVWQETMSDELDWCEWTAVRRRVLEKFGGL